MAGPVKAEHQSWRLHWPSFWPGQASWLAPWLTEAQTDAPHSLWALWRQPAAPSPEALGNAHGHWRWGLAEAEGLIQLAAQGARPSSPDEVARAMAEGHVGRGEVNLEEALWPWAPVWHQVRVRTGKQASYLADLVVLNPWDGRLWVVEVDGSWHDRPEAQARDRRRTRSLVRQGWGVARVGASLAGCDPVGSAQRLMAHWALAHRPWARALRFLALSWSGKRLGRL